MFCPACGAEIREDLQFCPNCGSALTAQQTLSVPEEAAPFAAEAPAAPAAPAYPEIPAAPAYPPAQPYAAPRAPVQKTPLALIGMILGIVSAVLSFVAYFSSILSAALSRGASVRMLPVLWVLIALLAIGAMVCSILGLMRSIRTGGRKYVAGIVFSSVGLACSVAALVLLFVGIVIGSLIRGIAGYYY